MRLSELSTDRAADVLCEISVHLLTITADEELLQQFKDTLGDAAGKTRAEMLMYGVDKIGKIIPLLLKKHKPEVLGILAVLNEKTPEQIGKQNIILTMSQIRDAIKDKELVNFIRSCVSEESA